VSESLKTNKDINITSIPDEQIRDIITNHINIIRFLYQIQENEEEFVKNQINTLFENIKSEMKPLKDKLKSEAVSFQTTNAQMFCPDIYDEKHKSVLEIIRQYLTPKTTEKKLFGEVFTPIELVCEMLSSLPLELWKNPYLTWLDPANGIGNFPLIVYFKLMVTLKDFKDDNLDLTDEQIRSTYILEKMLFMNELNPINVAICIKLFNMIDPLSKPNVNKGDFLKPDVFPGEKFDVIIGNPPFQLGQGGPNNRSAIKIYIHFIKKCINDMLNDKGYLLFITPHLSIKFFLGDKIQHYKLDKLYNIIYLNTSNTIKTKYFNKLGTNFMFFLVQNDDYKGITHLIDDNNVKTNIKLSFNDVLSTNQNISNHILNKLLKTNSKKSLWRKAARIDSINEEDIKKNDISDNEDIIHKHKLIVNLKTNQEDDEYKWTSKTHLDMFKYKVFYPTLGERYVIDKEHNLFSGSRNVQYILCNSLNECNNIIKLKNSKLFSYLKSSLKGPSPSDIVWRNLIKPGSFDIDINNDNDIYKYFNLTEADIDLIEETIE